MSLTLYWNLGSQPARAVKCLIDLGKLDVKYVTLDVIKNETRSKEYLSLNPLGKIPFLVDGEFKISESNAILVYLCEKYQQILGKYYGTTPQQRARVNQHLSWYQNFYRPALFKIIFLKVYQGIRQGKPVYAKYVQAAQKDMFQTIGQFEKLLKAGGTNFVAGDRVTIADFQYFFELTNLVIYEKPFSQYKLVTQWYNRVAQIPEVKAIAQQWLKMTPMLIQALKSVKLQPDSKL